MSLHRVSSENWNRLSRKRIQSSWPPHTSSLLPIRLRRWLSHNKLPLSSRAISATSAPPAHNRRLLTQPRELTTISSLHLISTLLYHGHMSMTRSSISSITAETGLSDITMIRWSMKRAVTTMYPSKNLQLEHPSLASTRSAGTATNKATISNLQAQMNK